MLTCWLVVVLWFFVFEGIGWDNRVLVGGYYWCFTIPAAALCCLIVVIGVICSSVWRVSIWLLSFGVSVVWCSTESPVIAVLASRVVG